MRDQLTATVNRLESEMRQAFLRDGSIMAMGTVMDAVGRIVDVVPHAGDDGFVGALCASCERHRAAAVWIAAEAWSALERPGFPGPRPSARPDRREVLLSQVEVAGLASRTRVWPIVRDGGSVGLGEMEEAKTTGGRLSDVLRRASSPIWTPAGAMVGTGRRMK